MNILQVIILAVVQGLAELLPVSSSAHVVVTEKLMGLDPSSPPMTLLLVMLHTGTMFAVIVYFWRKWKEAYFSDSSSLKAFVWRLIVATVLTGIIGEGIIKIIEKTYFKNVPHAQIEDLFSHLELIAPALIAAGIMILLSGNLEKKRQEDRGEMSPGQAGFIGAVQGLCLPFRGFSRSGATISAGMLAGVAKVRAENFSFALAVILTPFVVAREYLRLRQSLGTSSAGIGAAVAPSLLGMVIAFFAGLVALKWLSSWLEAGRWYLFGIYCIVAAAVVYTLHANGY